MCQKYSNCQGIVLTWGPQKLILSHSKIQKTYQTYVLQKKKKFKKYSTSLWAWYYKMKAKNKQINKMLDLIT